MTVTSERVAEIKAGVRAILSSPAEKDTNAFPDDDAAGLIGVFMDEFDWGFVIDCLRFRARQGAGADTVERATFTADSIQDVLDGAS